MKNRLTVKIQRKTYTFISDESQEYSDALAGQLDKKLNDCLKQNEGISTIDAAFLTAFECMDEIYKANKNIDNIRSQIKDYVDEASKAREEVEQTKKELEDALKKINMLREKNNALFAELKSVRASIKENAHEKKEEHEPTHNAQPVQSVSQNNSNGNYIGQMNYDPNRNGGHH